MNKNALGGLFCLAFLLISSFVMADSNYDGTVAEDTWVVKAPMSQARSRVGVAVVDGKIYAIGGMNSQNLALRTVEEYNPSADTWITKQSMPTARYSFGITVYNNKIYCFGGNFYSVVVNETFATNVIQVYDPLTDTWEKKKPMPTPRGQLQASTVNGKIYLMGGRTGGQKSTVSINEVYDPETESWLTKEPLKFPVISPPTVTIGSKIYLLGGFNEFAETVPVVVTQIYDTMTDTWSLGRPMPSVAIGSVAGVASGVFAPQRVYLLGGWTIGSGTLTNLVQVYDPSTDSWTTAAHMPSKRTDLSVAVVNDKLYAIGGESKPKWFGDWLTNENLMYTPIGYVAATLSPSTPYSSEEPHEKAEPSQTMVALIGLVTLAAIVTLLFYLMKYKRRMKVKQFNL